MSLLSLNGYYYKKEKYRQTSYFCEHFLVPICLVKVDFFCNGNVLVLMLEGDVTTVAPAFSLQNSATPYDAPQLSQIGDNLHVGCS